MGYGHRVAGVCKGSGEFCLYVSVAVDMAPWSKYLKDVPVSTWFMADEHKQAQLGCGRGCHCPH